MLDFTVDSPRRFLNDLVSLAGPGLTARAAGDRRATPPGIGPSPGVARKRRRHDNLNSAPATPLTW